MLPQPVVLGWSDTDLLDILVPGVTTNNSYIQYVQDSIYSIYEIQRAMYDQEHKYVLKAHEGSILLRLGN